MHLGVRLNLLFLLNFKRCELCPHKDGALKRTDNGGKYFCVEPVCLAVPLGSCPRCNFFFRAYVTRKGRLEAPEE